MKYSPPFDASNEGMLKVLPTGRHSGENGMSRSERSSLDATRASVSKRTADTVVGAEMSSIAAAPASDETVTIAGFGTFTVRTRAARQEQNPATGLLSPFLRRRPFHSRPPRFFATPSDSAISMRHGVEWSWAGNG